jgi:hypothetical protein
MNDKPSKFAGILRQQQEHETSEIEKVAKRGRPGGKLSRRREERSGKAPENGKTILYTICAPAGEAADGHGNTMRNDS